MRRIHLAAAAGDHSQRRLRLGICAQADFRLGIECARAREDRIRLVPQRHHPLVIRPAAELGDAPVRAGNLAVSRHRHADLHVNFAGRTHAMNMASP